MRRVLVVLVVMMAFATSVHAYQDDYIEVSLISEHSAFQPGSTHWIGVQFSPIERWHVYWRNPGDSGLSPKISLNLPEGLRAGDIHWPVPERIPAAHLINYGYHRTLLMIPVTVADSVHIDQSLTLKTNVSWLVCDDKQCIPGRAQLQVTLPVAERDPGPTPVANEFADARRALPKPLAAVASYRVDGDQVKLTVYSGQLKPVAIYPVTPELVANAEPPMISNQPDSATASFALGEYANDITQPFEFVLVTEDQKIYQGRATTRQ